METFTREGEFKGNKIITIIMGEYETKSGEKKENVFSFGVKKAEAIINHIGDIKKFVENNGHN